MGPYQFRVGTWRMHTRRPFSQAIQREAADEVAVLHYEWIKDNLEKAGVDAVAVQHCHGLEHWGEQRHPRPGSER